MLAQTIPLFRASGKMMLRSRGVIFAVAAGSVQILAFGLMKDLDFGLGHGRIGFFDFALPGMAVFLVLYQLQDIMVAVAANVPYAVPHTALIEAIRGIALTGAPITDYGRQVLIGAGWLALALVVAALAYRFTEE